MEELSKRLQIQRLEQLPSPADFESQTESKNVPAVFNGCIKQWKAFTSWNPANGGLDYLQEKAGSCTVEAMLSRTAPVFYGDLRSHERVPFPFSTFIDFCKKRLLSSDSEKGNHHQPAAVSGEEEEHAPQQIYLAQVPIANTEDQEKAQLVTLMEDIQKPAFLETKELASVNLWMNNAYSRSSTHYDPHHNVLCIVAGRKEVILWPPSASPSLYPMPVYGEASNHSSVPLENPDFLLYPRAECHMVYEQKVVLHAGDALFIPEGWFHQVDSDDLTIAVNFWWRSNIISRMLEHMDAYYLRRILRRLIDKEMDHILQKTSFIEKQNMLAPKLLGNVEADHSGTGLVQASEEEDLERKDEQQRVNLHMLEPLAMHTLHELVSLVHDYVNLSGPNQSKSSSSANDSVICMKGQHDKALPSNSCILDSDPVAKILWALDPHTLQNVLMAMALNFPRTLEAMILHLLSPVGAEVLTRKFDEIDQQNTEEDRNNFYRVFYGAFDDQFAAMDVMLNGKESFAFQAFKNVLDKYVGINIDVRKPSFG